MGKLKRKAKYDPPYSADQIKKFYGEDTYDRLKDDPAHKWRMETRLELIHKEPSLEELNRIYNNWLLMTDEMKKESDEKSMELFGVKNVDHYWKLRKQYRIMKKRGINESNRETEQGSEQDKQEDERRFKCHHSEYRESQR